MLNEINYEKHFNPNKGNRVEFWINNFDYFDGIDYLAKLFCERYRMQADEKVEGIFFDFIRVYAHNVEYVLMWHEDIGTLLYDSNQKCPGYRTIRDTIKRSCSRDKFKSIEKLTIGGRKHLH